MSFKRDPRRTSVGLTIGTERPHIASLYGVLEDEDRYYIRFLDTEDGDEVCLKSLMSRPNLALAAARFIHATSLSNTPASRKGKVKFFRYIFKYLDAVENLFEIDARTVSDLDQEIVDGYQKHLNGDRKFKSKLKLSASTKKTRYNFLISFLDWARATEHYSGRVTEIVSRSHQWAGAYRKHKGAQPLNAIQVVKTRKACQAEIIPILRKLRDGHSSAQSPKPMNLRTRSLVPFKEHEDKLAAFWRVINSENPTVEEFRSEYPGLSRALKAPYGRIDEVSACLFLTWRTVVPLVVFLGLETGYNPSVQCGTRNSDISDHPLWINTLRVAPQKHRANGKAQVRTFRKDDKNPFAVPSLLSAVQEIVGFYKHLAAPRDRRYLFLVWNRMGEKPRPLLTASRDVDANFYRALKEFCECHQLGEWTLSTLRQTFADLVHLISDGETEAIKTMMGHNSVWTAERHYNSAGQRARRAGGLAKAVRERQRFIDSAGKITLENSGSAMPVRAATPGFLCWDPFGSPIPGQKKGRLCSAYGYCPACPLACAQIDEPDVPKRFLQLKTLYLRTRDQTDHLRWAAQWNPQFEALVDIWLPMLDPAKISAASEQILEPLPRLE